MESLYAKKWEMLVGKFALSPRRTQNAIDYRLVEISSSSSMLVVSYRFFLIHGKLVACCIVWVGQDQFIIADQIKFVDIKL